MTTRLDRALGAVMGALCGDALGAVLEFLGRAPSEKEVDWAFTMPGGGAHGVAPGQITDDGEMTLALLRSACTASLLSGRRKPDLDLAAAEYQQWRDSRPFDIGHTTNHALAVTPSEGERISEALKRRARENSDSQANGSLMRASPLMLLEGLGRAMRSAEEDSRLTHSNETVCSANGIYVGLGCLLVGGYSAQQALDIIDQRVLNRPTDPVAREWYRDGRYGVGVPFHPNAGWARIAFTHAIRLLGEDVTWEEALREVLMGGGDTDTNACIVGALLGARHGLDGIPENVRTAVLRSDSSLGRPRPEMYHPELVLAMVPALELL